MSSLKLVDGDIREPIGAGIVRFIDHWAEHRAPDGGPPALSAIDGYELRALASGLVVFDAEPIDGSDGFRFRCREMGPRHRDFIGTDLTGKTLEDVFDHDDARFFSSIYWGVLTTGRPHYWRRPNAAPGREFEIVERVVAPVRDAARPLGTLVGLWQWAALPGPEDEVQQRLQARDRAGRQPGAEDPPSRYRLIIEAGRFPLAKDCAFEPVALMSTEAFVDTLRPVLEPIWRGLATRRLPDAAKEIELIEPTLDVSVKAALDAVPLDRFDRFVNALRPRLEELRAALAGVRRKLN